MAVIKHIAVKNTRYIDAVQYLKYQHNELNSKPIRDEYGHLVEREGILIDGIYCTPQTFPRDCTELNEKYRKNKSKEEIKAHHYILSFDPRDREDNGLTVERAQELGIDFCKEHFPGHQAIVCTHPDGHNGAGNIHVHIVINSLRMEDVERNPFMDLPSDSLAGFKHHVSDNYLEYLKQETMLMCQRENLYQVDLLSPAKVRITDREYWAARRGQVALDNQAKEEPNTSDNSEKSTFETRLAFLRKAITVSMEDSHSVEELKDKLLENYGIFLFESRGRFSYQIPEREKLISARKLGTDFDRPYIEAFFKKNAKQARKDIATPKPFVKLIVDLQAIAKAQENPKYAQKVTVTNIQEAAKTLLFIEENGIKNREELTDLLELAGKDKNEKHEKLKATEARLKTVNLLIKYSGQYYANKKTYSDYLRAKNKAQFRAEHDAEITLYEAARRQLKELSGGEKIPTLQHLKEEKESLTPLKNEQYEEFSFARAKHKEIQTVVANLDKVLSEKDAIDRETSIEIV
ncbi:MAG: relaxase/mobilization nuclease domain-containing protein [Oscillospiraceae bacterium]|nr:relaxase/mobilization nuclease domain-containing protein [Oscillospiraceae bacterium]